MFHAFVKPLKTGDGRGMGNSEGYSGPRHGSISGHPSIQTQGFSGQGKQPSLNFGLGLRLFIPELWGAFQPQKSLFHFFVFLQKWNWF